MFFFEGEHVVKKLTEPYYNKGHNVTTDQFFTSLKLAKFLLSKKTTIVGTMNKAKREIPRIQANSEKFSSKFFENKEGALLKVYQCKDNKYVVLLSTKHEKAEIGPDRGTHERRQKRKPNTIIYYNKTKCGVDSVDQMSRIHSVKYPTRRWPVQVWGNILNLGGINSWIVYKQLNNSKISRRRFIEKLIEEIAEMLQPESSTDEDEVPSTPARQPLRKRPRLDQQTPSTPKTVTCQIRLCSKNKANGVCSICSKSVCGKCCHSKAVVCKKCHEKNNE